MMRHGIGLLVFLWMAIVGNVQAMQTTSDRPTVLGSALEERAPVRTRRPPSLFLQELTTGYVEGLGTISIVPTEDGYAELIYDPNQRSNCTEMAIQNYIV